MNSQSRRILGSSRKKEREINIYIYIYISSFDSSCLFYHVIEEVVCTYHR